MKRFLLLVLSLVLYFAPLTVAQSILNPNDPVIRYTTGGSTPAQPAWGKIGKWISTDRSRSMPASWRSDAFKAYIYKGMAFRLQYPKSYNPATDDGKKYPVFVFWHGRGESGPITDNEWQLYHGAYIYSKAVLDGKFDGYLLYPQNTGGAFGNTDYDNVVEILEYMATNNKADLNRISLNGLSNGGNSCWDFMLRHPEYTAGSMPMSSAATGLMDVVNTVKFTPIWLFQGGRDGAPAPYTADLVVNAFKNAGANIRYTLYPTVAHDTWTYAWKEPDFIPFMNRVHILTPHVLFGRSEFCESDSINITIGIARGFDAYEWQRNGQLIPGSNNNELQVTALGSYQVRGRRGSTWTEWSPQPLVVKIKAPTETPPITTAGMMSNVLPSPDGRTTVTLQLPSGYTRYEWTKVGTGHVSDTDASFTTGAAGSYIARVTEQYGCSSRYSDPFEVISANGTGCPDGIQGLTATAISKTILQLNWNDKSNPQHNETAFEIYRAGNPNGPYTFAGRTTADVLTFTDNDLLPSTTYYYVVRPINENGAGPVSATATAMTIPDNTPPAAPASLFVNGGCTTTSIPLAWSAATDDVGIATYEVYINSSKAYTLDGNTTSVIAYGLQPRQTYTFTVLARDASGNVSPHSPQLVVPAVNNGLTYFYYEGEWDKIPDFNTLTPVKTGRVPVVDISPRLQNDAFGFMFEGNLRIPVSGTYYFQLTSSDGSRLYIKQPDNPAPTLVVDNDGVHNETTYQTGSISLNAGTYPVTLTYFDKDSTHLLSLRWRSSALGISGYVNIDSAYFRDNFTIPGTTPAAPAVLGASAVAFNKVAVTWTDNSSNETGFEIYRSTEKNGPFTIVGTTPANTVSFTDSAVNASTRYYYKIAAISKSGTGPLSSGIPYTGIWHFYHSPLDNSFNSNDAVLSGGAVFDSLAGHLSPAVLLNGSTAWVGIGGTNTGYLHDAFNARTFSAWIKPATLSGKRMILDIGGSSNGIALRLNGSNLEAAVAGSSVRKTITAPFGNAGEWKQVAVVYGNNTLRLYVNGILVATGTGSPSSVSTTTDNAGIGKTVGTNAFNDNTALSFSGYVDEIYILNQQSTDADIALLKNSALPIAITTTPSMPEPPAVPGNLQANVVAPGKVQLSWTDTNTPETTYEIHRASGLTPVFRKLASVNRSGNTIAFTDSSVFANTLYHYQVRALHAGGYSDYTAQVSTTTGNTPPVIKPMPGQTARYGTTTVIPVNATDADGDLLYYELSATNGPLPTFIDLQGTDIRITPDADHVGSYPLRLIAGDNHNGTDTITFTLTVNDNYNPVIGSISAVSMQEGEQQQVAVTVSDQNAEDTFSWEGVDLPGFITVTGNNNSAAIRIKPGYVDAGTYTVKIKVTDNEGGSDIKTFPLTIAKKDPNDKILVNFKLWTDAPAPWNNITTLSTYNLKNERGEGTGLNFLIQGNWWATSWQGPNTGNNSGVYPDDVMREYYFFGSKQGYFGGPDSVTVKVTGLDIAKKYSFRFYAGSVWSEQPDNGSTTFSIGPVRKTLAVQNNTTQTVSIPNITPGADSSISFVMSRPPGVAVGYLNAVEIAGNYDDGLAPAIPRHLSTSLPNGLVQLSWTDVAYNENGYQIYRSADSIGTYSLISTTTPNVTVYTDSLAAGNHQYFYKLRAVNSRDTSGFSNIAGVRVPNKIPQLDLLSDVKLKAGDSLILQVRAYDDAGDSINLSIGGLPPFATFTDNRNGTGTLKFKPTNDHLGSNLLTVYATDNHGGSASTEFRVFTSDKNIVLTYFNIAEIFNAPAPWNNITGYPYAGTKITNALDEYGTPNGMTFSLNENWSWAARNGVNTGENTGIYSDLVLKTNWFESSEKTVSIVIGGLSSSKLYNFVFFNSQDFGTDASTRFTINDNSVVLNAAYNSRKTVQLNGIAPVNGKVTITMNKLSGAYNAYLNALVVETYNNTLTLVSPAGLRAEAVSSDKIRLNWADRASTETGYQVYRRSIVSGIDSLIATLPTNTTTYLDDELQPNQRYTYRVRAMRSSTRSDFSNTASVVTYAMSVYVNFSENKVAGAPWNNTGRRPSEGSLITGLKDDNGNRTHIGIDVLANFAGVYGNPGMNTGNNSGIYPDNVMLENYVLFAGGHAALKIKGLSQHMGYNLTFFASAVDWLDLTTRFTANGKRVTWLNAALNKSGNAIIYNVLADEKGEIRIDIDPGENASYGLLGALIIQGYTTPPASITQGNELPPEEDTTLVPPTVTMLQRQAVHENNIRTISPVSVYPNPFVNTLHVDLQVQEDTWVQAEIIDLSGRIIYREPARQLPRGRSTLRIPGSRVPAPGYYLLRITDNRRQQQVIRVIKQ